MPKVEAPEDVRPDGLPVLMTTAEVAEMLQVDASTLPLATGRGRAPGDLPRTSAGT